MLEATALPLARRILDDLRVIGLDTPYRVLASFAGIAALVAWRDDAMSRPSDAVLRAANWAGVDIADAVGAVAGWVAEERRADAVAACGLVLVALGLLVLAAYVERPGYRPFDGMRCAATVVVGLALYQQARGDRLDWNLVSVLVPAALWAGWKLRHLAAALLRGLTVLRRGTPARPGSLDRQAATLREVQVAGAAGELVLAVWWVPVALLGCLLLGPFQGSRRSDLARTSTLADPPPHAVAPLRTAAPDRSGDRRFGPDEREARNTAA